MTVQFEIGAKRRAPAWSMVPVSELAEHCLGKMLDKNKNKGTLRPYLRNLNVRWFDFDMSDILEMRFEDYEADRYQARRGDLIVCEGGYPGRAAIWQADEPVFLQKALHRVRFHEAERAKWLLYWLHYRDLNGSLSDEFSGTGIQHFTKAALSRFKIPLPPLEEQNRIVAVLDRAFVALDQARSRAEANLAEARSLLGSVRDRILEKVCIECLSGPLARHLTNVTYGFTNPMPDADDGPWKVTAKNVVNGAIDYTNARHTTPDAFNKELTGKSRPKIGDVLLTKDGTLGRTAVVDRANICVNQSVAVLSPKEGIDPYFLSELLSTSEIQKAMIDRAGGTTIKHLYITRVAETVVRIPTPERQVETLSKLDHIALSVSKLCISAERKLSDCADLRQSLLQKAFSGELT